MKYLLDISDLNQNDFFEILDQADELNMQNEAILSKKSIGLIFEKYSTRTRLSFQVGIRQLQGNPIDIKFEELNLQRIETFNDTFKIFGCYLDALVFRTDNHEKLQKALECFNKPIINALSDKSHPCQIISDIFTLREHFKKIDNISICWLGDLNNVLFSLVEAMSFLPKTSLNIFTDENLFNNSKFKKINKASNINFFFDLEQKIIKETDCIMTDVYSSMNDEVKLDKEKILKRFQINDKIMDYTKNECVFMHCLPAKIDSEVTQSVLSSSKSIVLHQAKNRLVAQKGILKWLEI
ncbi:MAG: hypothetical protein CMI90_00290 [Pelagibacteraceae bacterium]|nr:hypothetical protein [Pelagibacteraceae bacterium]